MKRIRDFFKKHNLLAIIIIATVFGLGGGLVGEITARAYFIDPLFGLSLFGNLDFSTGKYSDQGLTISNANNVIVQQDAKVNETIDSVSSSLVGIYKKPPQAVKQKAINSGNVFKPENFYKLNEPSGQGFILSSDGWIVTSLALVKNYSDYVVITKDKTILEIDQVAADNLTAFNFIHVQARDLQVRKFTDSQAIKNGSLAVAVDWQGLGLVAAAVGSSDPAGSVKSSDSFSDKLTLNEKLPPEFKGSVIFNLAGDALGLVNDKGEIEPINHFAGVIKSLFKNQKAIRPSLGVNYIDLANLAEIAGLPPASAGGAQVGQKSYWQKGAIIYKDQKAVAVKKNSPAERSGLREGDIIISVDDISLDKDHDLSNLIQNYQVGETVSLVILRQGVEQEVKVTLGELNK